MDDRDWLAGQFEEHRPSLRAVAYRMLGSPSEADDAVQESWLRLSRDDRSDVENLGAWLTTVVGRVSLNMLRTRRTQPEEPLGVHVPEPIVERRRHGPPARGGAGRLRGPGAARGAAAALTARARRGPGRQREVVDAFLAAAREGDFEALVAVLHPDVVLRVDQGVPIASREVRGAETAARQAAAFAQLGIEVLPAIVNGAAGTVTLRDGQAFAISGITVRDGRIVEMDILADPERLRRPELTFLEA